MPTSERAMTPPEKYYALLDETWRTNVLIFGELDRRFDPGYVEQCWRTYVRTRILARTVATPELTLRDAGEAVHFSAVELPAEEWDRYLHDEAHVEYGLGWPLRCRYLTSPDEDRSRVLVVGHHSIIDGRIGLAELQAFVRILDGQDVPAQATLADPGPPTTRHSWQADRRAKLELLRSIATTNQELGDPGPAWWPAASTERDLRFATTVVDAERTRALLAAGRTRGSSLFSTWAATWLQAVARTYCGAADQVLQLNAPIDLATPSADPSVPTAMAVAVLARRYRVGTDLWQLATQIGEGTAEALARGEAELFFNLAQVDRVQDLETGREAVAAGLRGAPPALTVSNMGLVDPGSDPPWLRLVAGTLAPTPNQVVFSAVLGYRGRLVQVVSVDRHRVDAARVDAVTAAADETFGRIADEVERAQQVANTTGPS
jgi:hypothetical protein